MNEQIEAAVMVVDRAHIAKAKWAATVLEEPSGDKGARGWSTGLGILEGRSDLDYLLMFATDRYRCAYAAPVVLAIDNLANLLAAVNKLSLGMTGTNHAMWMILADAEKEIRATLSETSITHTAYESH
jgi:hypothetical protein